MPRTVSPTLPQCPQCGNPQVRWLEWTSTVNGIDAFQCLACGHVWTAPRATTDR